MSSPAALPAGEVTRLQRCLNDLLSVLTLPAIWTGRSPPQIAGSFADGLLRVLRLDVAYVRLTDDEGVRSDCLRVAHGASAELIRASESFPALGDEIGDDLTCWPRRIAIGASETTLSIKSVRLGLHAGQGVVVAGSQRHDFPSQSDELLLNVAANQLLLALQEAQLRLQQQHAAELSDRRVAERTTELAATNAALRKEIGERKHAEEELRRSEAFLVEGQNLARIGNFSWLVTTDEMKWSEQLYRIFEFESGTPVTLELLADRVHPDDRPSIYAMIGQAQRAASDLEYACRLLMPDGSIKHLQLVAHATRDQQGRLEYLGAVQDVTQRRTSDEALSQARTELANVAQMTSLGVLTAAIAHEVNQPISGIITNASTCLMMLTAQPPNITGAMETARRAIRDGNRASDVITRLRTLYTRKGMQPEPMDLNEAAQEVVSLTMSELQRNGVVLRQELAGGLPRVNADRIQLQQVILNLLRNASDAMRTVEDRSREIVIRTGLDGAGGVHLSVRDAGIGFTSQAAEKIFEPFHTTKSDGMGIGLSVSRSIIEAHRGRLWATPNEGAGVTFVFSLPLQADGAEQPL